MRHLSPMGRQRLLLACSLAGVLLGAALIGRWATGLALIADSVFGVWWALYRDVPGTRPAPRGVLTEEQVLDRAWRSSWDTVEDDPGLAEHWLRMAGKPRG